MTEHDTMKDLAAGYVLLALEAEERNAFARHLEGCRECAREVAELRAVLDVMPDTVQSREPSPRLKDRILAAARADRTAPRPSSGRRRGVLSFWPLRNRKGRRVPASREVPPAAQRRRGFRAHPALAAAVGAACLAIAVAAVLTVRAQLEMREADARLDESYRALRVMAAAEQRWQVTGGAVAPRAAGILAYSARQNQSSMVLWGLPLEPGKRYVAWTQQDGNKQQIGTMREADGGLWLVMEGDVRAHQGVGVSMRDASGAAQVIYFDLAQPSTLDLSGPAWGD